MGAETAVVGAGTVAPSTAALASLAAVSAGVSAAVVVVVGGAASVATAGSAAFTSSLGASVAGAASATREAGVSFCHITQIFNWRSTYQREREQWPSPWVPSW